MNRFNFNPLEKYAGISTSDTPSPYAARVIKWGRAATHAPYMQLSPESEESLRTVQQELTEKFPDAKPIDTLHATILYCQPQYLLHALCKIRGIDPAELKPAYEATFYSDIENAIDATTIMSPYGEVTIPVDSLETFNQERGTVALKLAKSVFTEYFRNQSRLLMVRNLEMFHGVTPDEKARLREDPKLTWLFQDSLLHISLAHNVVDTDGDLTSVELPESVGFDTVQTDRPFGVSAKTSLLLPWDY